MLKIVKNFVSEYGMEDFLLKLFYYIYAGNGLTAIMEHSGGQDNLYYTHCDYQGNLLAVTDVGGTVKERYAYDAWGLRRNPANWTKTDTRISFLFSRGYTLHEHLDDFGLINMNGRVYDPLMAQFLSPDPYIQSPSSWLNYNRYAYGFNNPLIYTDPDGEWIVPVIGFIVGAYLGGTASNNWEWNPGKWDNSASTWMSTIMGGVAGAVGGSYLFGTNGVFAGGTSLNISLGLNINNIAAPVANFVVSNGGVALKGLGYVTAAGGGAWFTSDMIKGLESKGMSIDMTAVNNARYRDTWRTAIGLTIDWALGIGEENRSFTNDAVANSFRDARVINQARDYWYYQVNAGNKTIYDGVTNFLGRKAWTGGNFGVKGFIAAGLDPMEQFVGSFTPAISSDGRNLTFTIHNTTSFRSLMYGIAPDWFRSTWRPGGNMSQTYIFTEPINFNRIR